MASNKWEDVLNDKSTYSDDHVLKLADGTEVRLGDIRPSHMKDADYRQKTALLARQREEWEAQRAAQLQALQEGEAHLRTIATELLRQNPNMTRQEVAQEMSADPEVVRLRGELAEIKGVLKPMTDAIMEMRESAKTGRQQAIVNEHRKALADLKAQDPDLDTEALVYYAKDNLIPNLRKAYVAMNHEKIVESKVKEARESAYKEGHEKARLEAQAAPILPMRTVVPQRVEGAPKDMREAMNKALNDPDVMGPLTTGRIGG